MEPVMRRPVETPKVARIQASSALSKAAKGTRRPTAITPPGTA